MWEENAAIQISVFGFPLLVRMTIVELQVATISSIIHHNPLLWLLLVLLLIIIMVMNMVAMCNTKVTTVNNKPPLLHCFLRTNPWAHLYGGTFFLLLFYPNVIILLSWIYSAFYLSIILSTLISLLVNAWLSNILICTKPLGLFQLH